MEYPCQETTKAAIGAAIEVHRTLGPGLLESVYETCLAHELELREVEHQRQVALPVHYKDVILDGGLRMDLVIDDQVVVELKVVERLQPIHEAQLITYLKLAKKPVGLLINFNVSSLRDGIKRLALTES